MCNILAQKEHGAVTKMNRSLVKSKPVRATWFVVQVIPHNIEDTSLYRTCKPLWEMSTSFCTFHEIK